MPSLKEILILIFVFVVTTVIILNNSNLSNNQSSEIKENDIQNNSQTNQNKEAILSWEEIDTSSLTQVEKECLALLNSNPTTTLDSPVIQQLTTTSNNILDRISSNFSQIPYLPLEDILAQVEKLSPDLQSELEGLESGTCSTCNQDSANSTCATILKQMGVGCSCAPPCCYHWGCPCAHPCCCVCCIICCR